MGLGAWPAAGRLRLRIGSPAGRRAGLEAGSRSVASRRPGGGAGGSPAANGRAAPEQLQRAGARPPRRLGRWGEARFVEARRRPGRAASGGGGTMEAAPAAPRPGLLLLVLAAAATLVPGTTGEWRRGWRAAAGRAGRARPLARSFFLKHGAGPGAQVAAPGPGLGFLTRQPPREPRARSGGGTEACVRM